MGDANPVPTLVDYSKPSHKGYRNTIELPVANNVVPLRSNTILLVQNGCLFHGIRFEDLNQHLKDFLKFVDSLNLDGENRERTRLRLFQFSLRDQASNWLKRLPAGSITTWEDLTTCFLAQFFPPGRTAKLCNDILMFQQHHGEYLSEAWTHFKDLLQNSLIRASTFGSKSKFFMTMSILSQDEPLTNRPMAIIDRIAGALPSDTIKNSKLNASPVLSACSDPKIDPQCSSHPSTSINAIKAHSKEANIS
ncbi:zinc finger, CCHC-type containing protein [Tanacetum coccineum]